MASPKVTVTVSELYTERWTRVHDDIMVLAYALDPINLAPSLNVITAIRTRPAAHEEASRTPLPAQFRLTTPLLPTCPQPYETSCCIKSIKELVAPTETKKVLGASAAVLEPQRAPCLLHFAPMP
jgi:hypothetical protein